MDKCEIASLVKLYQSGDNEAGWILILSQRNLLGSLIKSKLDLDGSIDHGDVLHEMYLAILKDLMAYDPARLELPGFIVMAFWRRISRIIKKLSSIGSEPLPDICVYKDMEAEVDSQETFLVLLSAIEKVRPLHKEVFLLWANDASREQIASTANDMLGRNAFTARTIKAVIDDSVDSVRSVLQKELEDLR